MCYTKQKFLILVKSVVSLTDCVFSVVFEKSPPYYKRPPRFSMLSSRRFIVLLLKFGSMINFELIFVKDIRSVSRITFFFSRECPVALVPFVAQKCFLIDSFLHLYPLPTCLKNNNPVFKITQRLEFYLRS